MKRLPALILLLLLPLASCRTVKQAAGQTACAARRDTVRLTELRRDSIFSRDSIFQSLVTKGDTVFLTRTATRYAWRDRWRTDTVYKSRTDTLRTTDYKWREREGVNVPWQAAALFAISLAIGAALVYYDRN